MTYVKTKIGKDPLINNFLFHNNTVLLSPKEILNLLPFVLLANLPETGTRPTYQAEYTAFEIQILCDLIRDSDAKFSIYSDNSSSFLEVQIVIHVSNVYPDTYYVLEYLSCRYRAVVATQLPHSYNQHVTHPGQVTLRPGIAAANYVYYIYSLYSCPLFLLYFLPRVRITTCSRTFKYL